MIFSSSKRALYYCIATYEFVFRLYFLCSFNWYIFIFLAKVLSLIFLLKISGFVLAASLTKTFPCIFISFYSFDLFSCFLQLVRLFLISLPQNERAVRRSVAVQNILLSLPSFWYAFVLPFLSSLPLIQYVSFFSYAPLLEYLQHPACLTDMWYLSSNHFGGMPTQD